jgi:WD40 repeat protein
MRYSFVRRSVLVSFAALALLSGGFPALAGWDVKPDPPGKPLQLAVKPGMALPLPNPPGLWPLYPTTPSAFVAVGQNNVESDVREVWDLQAFQRTGAIKGKLGSSHTSPMRLSPDGKFLAVTATDADPDRALEVWSFADGKLVKRIEPKPRPKKILGFDFAGDGRLVVVIESEIAKLLQIHDFNTGAVVATHGLPAKFQENSLAFSPGRKYVAYLTDAELRVVELEKGKLVGSQPAKGLCNGMAFSPDGTELAGLFFAAPGGRLIVWDFAKGEVVVEHALPSGPTFKTPGWGDAGARSIDWLPDGSAWLLAGHALVNRKDGRWVWSVFAPAYMDANGKMKSNALIYSQAVKLLDNDHALAALKARTGGRLEVVALPWPQIDASLKAVETNAPALLKSGGSLSLKFSIGNVRFSTAKEVEAGLTEAIRDGLAAEGITVADGQPVVLQVKYAEEPGPPYRILGPGASGNQSVTSTRFTTELSLIVPGTKGPVWTDQKIETGLGRFTTSRKTGGRVDEAGMREGGFEGVKESVKSLGLPYFIPRPQDKNLAMLPGTTVLAASATPTRTSETNPNNTKLDKPTTRGQSKGVTKKP